MIEKHEAAVTSSHAFWTRPRCNRWRGLWILLAVGMGHLDYDCSIHFFGQLYNIPLFEGHRFATTLDLPAVGVDI